MKRRKSEVKAIRKRRPLSRREMLSTVAAGVGALAVAGVAQGQGAAESQLPQAESQLPHWVSWDDGIAYPVHDIAEDGSWIVKFDDGFFAVDPAGFVYDSGVRLPRTASGLPATTEWSTCLSPTWCWNALWSWNALTTSSTNSNDPSH